MQRYCVLIDSANALVRTAVAQLIEGLPGFRVGTGIEDDPHVVLHVHATGLDCSQHIRDIRTRVPAAPIVSLNVAGDETAARSALRARVSAVVESDASPQLLAACLRRAAEGRPRAASAGRNGHGPLDDEPLQALRGLTPREVDVLGLVTQGRTNREIAMELSLSEHTVRAHLRGIMQKLNVRNRVEAATRLTQSRGAVS